MRLSAHVKFTIINQEGVRFPVSHTDIGNLESFEIVYEYTPLDSSPLVSTTDIQFQGAAAQQVRAAFSQHDKVLYLELQHYEFSEPIKYAADLASMVDRDTHVQLNLVLLNLYNAVADMKSTKFDVDLNEIKSYQIGLPDSRGLNRMLFYSGMDSVDTNQQVIFASTEGLPIKFGDFRVDTGMLALPMTHYKSDIINQDAFLTTTTSPVIVDSVIGRVSGDILNSELDDPKHKFYPGVGGEPNVARGVDLTNPRYDDEGINKASSPFLLRSYGKTKINDTNVLTPGIGKVKLDVLYGGVSGATNNAGLKIGDPFDKIRVEVYLTTYKIDTLRNIEIFDSATPIRLGVAEKRLSPSHGASVHVERNVEVLVDARQVSDWVPESTGVIHDALRLEFRVYFEYSHNSNQNSAELKGMYVGFENLYIDPDAPILIDVEYEAEFATKLVHGYKAIDLLRAGLSKMIKGTAYEDTAISVAIDNIDPAVTSLTESVFIVSEAGEYVISEVGEQIVVSAMASTFDENPYELFFLPEESLKNRTKKVYYFKLDEFVKTMYGLGYHLYSGEDFLNFRKRPNTQYVQLEAEGVSDLEFGYSSVLTPTVEIGYNLDDTSIGLLDPHRRSSFRTNVPHKIDTLSYILPYKADAIGLLKKLDAVKDKKAKSDRWWDYLKPNKATHIGVDTDSTDTGVFMILAQSTLDGDVYSAPAHGAPEELAHLNLFNWGLSVVGLLHFMSGYLKYSGRLFEFISSYGTRVGSVQVLPYDKNTQQHPAIPLAPVYPVNASLIQEQHSTEEYSEIELSTTVLLSPTQLRDIIFSNSNERLVKLSFPGQQVEGILLKASTNLIFENAVDITMLVTRGIVEAAVPGLKENQVVPYEKAYTIPEYVGGFTTFEYSIFINIPSTLIDVKSITSITSPSIANHIQASVDNRITVGSRKYVKIVLRNLYNFPEGEHIIELTLVTVSGDVTVRHKILINK